VAGGMPVNLITEVDAWALANARAASCCEAMMAITCGISASDDCEPSYAQDVNLLHIAPKLSVRTYFGGVRHG